jgi:hypothetical protein
MSQHIRIGPEPSIPCLQLQRAPTSVRQEKIHPPIAEQNFLKSQLEHLLLQQKQALGHLKQLSPHLFCRHLYLVGTDACHLFCKNK